MTAFALDTRPDGIAILTFDLPGEKVNKLTTPVMDELDLFLDRLASDGHIKALVIASGKKDIFVAGADIAEIQDIMDEAKGEALSRKGQSLMRKLASLPFPAVAAIHGACMGGGLELALACSHRVASDHAKTILGFPEVNIGIIPGFGGTQRLPRLIGLKHALDMIVTGKSVDTISAEQIGLVDEVSSPQSLIETAVNIARQAAERPPASAIWSTRPLSAWIRQDNPLTRAAVFRKVLRKINTATQGNYPAPPAALDAVRHGLAHGPSSGYENEAKAFGRLSVSAVSKNLINVFYLSDTFQNNMLPAIVNDGPGSLVNRILLSYFCEALRMLEEGSSIEEIDRALLTFGMPKGAFILLDEYGIDNAYTAAKHLHAILGERMRPPTVLERLYEEGFRGKKNGRGFYRYAKGVRKGAYPLPCGLIQIRSDGSRMSSEQEIIERIVFLMVKEAILCLEDRIIDRPDQLDAALLLSMGFPTFRGGLLKYAESLGAKHIVERLEVYKARYGERFTPPASLFEMSRDDFIGQIVS